MAYKKSLNKNCYNSEYFIVVYFGYEYFYSKNTQTYTVNIDIRFTNHFKPFCAMTVHTAQGMTINNDYAIYEYDIMKHDMLYAALTRTSKEEYVNFCGIKVNQTENRLYLQVFW